jgi:predicted transposase YbfD/YdcC
MNTIGMVESIREVDGKCSAETRFFIGSIGTDAQTFARAVRCHWGIENELHWGLDVAFREDDSRVRETAARENLAVLRHIAMTRLKQDPAKLGIKTKRLYGAEFGAICAAAFFRNPSSVVDGRAGRRSGFSAPSRAHGGASTPLNKTHSQ